MPKSCAISLGQGQGPIAERLIAQAMERGTWIVLQNCHLSSSWMPRLEALVEQYDADAMHKDYRLWLTSMPSDKFPVSILQNSVKMTNEPPRGVKMNVKLSYSNFTDAYLNAQAKPPEFKKLLYGTCFFHALLQDRRKFGALGFNIRYEFTTGDLKCCILQLEAFLARYDEVPYDVLRNLIGHINYSGRVTDDWDRRMLMTMLNSIINDGIMADDFPLAPGEGYLSPPSGDVASYVEGIERLPLNPHPNVFGLHENADISCAQDETEELCRIMLSLQPKVASGGGKSRDDGRRRGARAAGARAQAVCDGRGRREVPADVHRVDEHRARAGVHPVQQADQHLHPMLSDVLKALKGLVVMSAELEAMATSSSTTRCPRCGRRWHARRSSRWPRGSRT